VIKNIKFLNISDSSRDIVGSLRLVGLTIGFNKVLCLPFYENAKGRRGTPPEGRVPKGISGNSKNSEGISGICRSYYNPCPNRDSSFGKKFPIHVHL
jgi:hypothetical protein